MTPVINAEDMSLSRNIQVNLTLGQDMTLPPIGELKNPTLADYFQAGLDTETEPVQFTDPEDDGTFTASFLYLLPDQDYQVRVELKDGLGLDFTLSPTSPQTVSLTSAQDETVAFQVNPQPPPET